MIKKNEVMTHVFSNQDKSIETNENEIKTEQDKEENLFFF